MSDADAPFDRRLTALLDEARSAEAAAERTRHRWLRQQAHNDARLTGLLLAAREHGDTLTIRTTAGRAHTGRVSAVGPDVVVVRTTAGAEAAVKLSAVAVVQPDVTRTAVPAVDGRGASDVATLAGVVADRAPHCPRVVITASGVAAAVVGRLLAAGADVATVELDDRRGVVYVSLESASEVTFVAAGGLGSG